MAFPGSQFVRQSASKLYEPPLSKEAGLRTFSTSPDPSPEVGVQQRPIWYRFRTLITTVLVVNAVLVGYALFRTSSAPEVVEVKESSVEGDDKEKKHGRKSAEVDQPSQSNPGTPTDSRAIGSEVRAPVVGEGGTTTSFGPAESTLVRPAVIAQLDSQVKNQQIVSPEVQQNLYKWMLEEKRKIKPASSAEKAQLDRDKALLKKYIREKQSLSN